jgi:hypothetical protein
VLKLRICPPPVHLDDEMLRHRVTLLSCSMVVVMGVIKTVYLGSELVLEN